MANYIIFGVCASIASWMVGIIITGILIRTKYYERLSNMNFIKSHTVNKYLGIKYFKWIVKNSFFKYFNQEIKVRNRNTDLLAVRKAMAAAEIGHLVGFITVLAVALYMSIATRNLLFGLVIMTTNVIFNLYPSLLQQENKRRIDRLINRRNYLPPLI